jgi:hypothetical protein
MAGTRRARISHPLRQRFTLAALDAFRRMKWLETQCTCPPRDWAGEYWKHQQCSACDQWYEQHNIMHRELSMPPWRWPCVESPHAQNPFPEGSPAAANWAPDKNAQALWRALDEAA